tara:strand:+ start:147 stop:497 length:351 start_codon:yes stop_codon:yes gene_type:complete
METKDELIRNIKEWVLIDSEMRNLQSKLRELRNNKKSITTQLIDVMRDNEIDCFDIKDGQIIYSKTKVKVPLNKKTMHDLLAKYFNNDNQADNLVNYIMENREEKEKESIKRKINN